MPFSGAGKAALAALLSKTQQKEEGDRVRVDQGIVHCDARVVFKNAKATWGAA